MRLGTIAIVLSIGASIALSMVMDAILLWQVAAAPGEIAAATILFNATVILLSGVGAIIERRRPGHAIGRLLMLSGPLYAFLGLSWLTAEVLEQLIDPVLWELLFWHSSFLSWLGVAIIIAWIPLLFPTGTLPGPRWRVPAIGLALVFLGSLVLVTAQTSLAGDRDEPALGGSALAILVAVQLMGMTALGGAAVVTRYLRGDPTERAQIRWLGAAVALTLVGFGGSSIQSAVQPDDGPLLVTLVAYAGILAIPIAIGIAVTRYRLYEIDRLISRTIGWAIVTGALVTVFVGLVVTLQAALAAIADENTLAVAVSTLVAFALFQPLRRRVQRAVDRRFDRARYDGELTAAAFAERMRNETDLEGLVADITATVTIALRPATASVWVRGTLARASR